MLWINANDELSTDKSVTLKGWIGNFLLIRYKVKNLQLEFYYQDKKIGETQTDKLGRFYLDYTFPDFGTYQVIVKMKGFYSLDTVINVLLINPEDQKEMIVCDIDNTLVQFSMLAFLFRLALNEIEGAKETLNLLKQKYHIIYLTHRERRFSNITKKWLLNHDFPISPVFFWSAKEDPFFSKKYKMDALKRIKEKAGARLAIGIGDKPGDIEAYKSCGIPRTFSIKGTGDWDKVREVFTYEIRND